MIYNGIDYTMRFRGNEYSEEMRWYIKMYENDYYCLNFMCRNNDGSGITQGMNLDDVKVSVHAKSVSEYPHIGIPWMVPIEGSEKEYVKIYELFKRSARFSYMDLNYEESRQNTRWIDAFMTVFEIDKVVRDNFPGYCITTREGYYNPDFDPESIYNQ